MAPKVKIGPVRLAPISPAAAGPLNRLLKAVLVLASAALSDRFG
jgi:hypothetical protein